jgi:hypothetical protein
MPTFPNRCQHIKVNGTQCGCPALRRNQLCYFHKRHHDERAQLNLDRTKNDRLKAARRRPTTIDLPVLEDANSIQVSLMQIMRLIITGEIDAKTAGLLLYALQTASANLSRTNFEPNRHHVILNPAAANETQLGESVWRDDDFAEDGDEEQEEQIDSAKEAGIRKAAEFLYSLDVERDARIQAAKSAARTSETKTSENPLPPRKPPVPEPAPQQVREQNRQALPEPGQSLQTADKRGG